MAQSTPIFNTLQQLSPFLHRTDNDPRPIVLMTCGIAGSGKSSLSKWITTNHPSFKRLSIDSYVYAHHGLYSVDYPKEKYNDYLDEAELALRDELAQLIRSGDDVVLDFSFAFQTFRNEWKSLVEELGGRWVLVYLDVRADELRRRVRARNQLAVKDGDSAFLVTDEILDRYLAGFERPVGEGEVVLCLDGFAANV
ncbi:hypothetical protein PHISCL_02609 [Aspergillus sclerotialis]|uniref:ATP/GTP-binding protein n=1 Tax=Aspergillus sclerotialis TaxID=2070753 RepID=A0A3A3A0A5_9EURO|nr:hypothetical protein PHISCL_02609 [Aspergillus sclerotialis]